MVAGIQGPIFCTPYDSLTRYVMCTMDRVSPVILRIKYCEVFVKAVEKRATEIGRILENTDIREHQKV